MNAALTSAAERLITLPGFKWMPGMLVANDGHRPRYIRTYDDGVMHFACEVFADSMDMMRDGSKTLLPDLTDPATLGCVLAMVRQAHADPGIGVVQSQSLFDGDLTPWLLATGSHVFDAATEAECLVNALAAAGVK